MGIEKEESWGKEVKTTSPPPGAEPGDDSFGVLPDMDKLYAESMGHIQEGNVVKGRIVRIVKDEVYIDIHFKSEGIVPLREFGGRDTQPVQVGDEVEVYLETLEDEDGQLILSKSKADQMRSWNTVLSSYDERQDVEGRVVGRVKGGLKVDIDGLDAFLPASQIDVRQVQDLGQYSGKTIKVRIIKLNRKRRNVVVSRRAVLEEERMEKRSKLLADLEVGQLRKGLVKNITSYGAFVDLGGIDGLLHITDMSWGKVKSPNEVVKVDEEIDVAILSVDRERQRVSLGLKQKYPDPWTEVGRRYRVNSHHNGKVTNLTEYGAFVELEPGIEGLVHMSEMSWTKRFRHPNEILSVGDEVEVVVLGVDQENRRISLGTKQTEANPWLTLGQRYPIGTRITGKVQNITDFGIFVEIEAGIDGLIRNQDLSWMEPAKQVIEGIQIGQTLDVSILNIDVENHKVSLGLKQLTRDPWHEVAALFPAGTHVKGKVTKVANFGVFVELEKGIEGLVHVSQIAQERVEKPEDVIKVGEEIQCKVVRVEPENRKIGLSIKEYKEDIERGETGGDVRQAATEAAPSEKKEEAPGGMVLGEVLGDHLERISSMAEATVRSKEEQDEGPEPEAASESVPKEAEPSDAETVEPAAVNAEEGAKPAEPAAVDAEEGAKPAEPAATDIAEEKPPEEPAKAKAAKESKADAKAKVAKKKPAKRKTAAKKTTAKKTAKSASAKTAAKKPKAARKRATKKSTK